MRDDWVQSVLGIPRPREGERVSLNGCSMEMRGGVLRDLSVAEPNQAQTRDTFAFKWKKCETYSSPAARNAMRSWLRERYGDFLHTIPASPSRRIALLDAGCGAAFSAELLFGDIFRNISYVGTDISTAIDIAAKTVARLAGDSLFVQADLMHLPFAANAFDFIFSEGVLHHTPSTRKAIHGLVPYLKPGGVLAFYVYAKKAPTREFTDDYVRGLISELPQEDAWDLLMPLTKLGWRLGS